MGPRRSQSNVPADKEVGNVKKPKNSFGETAQDVVDFFTLSEVLTRRGCAYLLLTA